MLEDCLFASRPSARSKKPATLVLSVIVHGTLAGGLIVIPLFQAQVLPQIPLFEPLRPPVAAPRSVELVPVPKARSAAPSSKAAIPQAVLTVPIAIPNDIAKIKDAPASGPVGYTPGHGGNGISLDGTGPFGNPFSIPGGSDRPLAPPRPEPVAAPPPPAPEPPPDVPIRRGGEVVQSNLIHTVQPIYPRLAVITRSHGKVILEAVITREGAIDPERLRVLQTENNLLTQAAIDAVRQWRYRPTLLNGKPVEVLTTITITFTLN